MHHLLHQGLYDCPISPSSAANIALTISSVPTSRTAIYDLTFIIDTSTYKQYINSISVNGTSKTMVSPGGLSNITVSASASVVVQTISIHMTNSTITNVYTSVASLY